MKAGWARRITGMVAVTVCFAAVACRADSEVRTDRSTPTDDTGDHEEVDHWTVAGDAVEMLAAGNGLVLVYGFETSLVELRTGDVIATETIDGLDGPPELNRAIEEFRVDSRDVLVRTEDGRILAGEDDSPPLLPSGSPVPTGPLPVVHVGPYTVENSLDGAVIRHDDGAEWRFPVEEPQFDEKLIAVDDWVILGMSDSAGTVLAIDLTSPHGVEAAALEWADMYPPPPPRRMDGGPEEIARVTAAATEFAGALQTFDFERLRPVMSAECWDQSKAKFDQEMARATPEDLAELIELMKSPAPVPEVVEIDGDVATVYLPGVGDEISFVLRNGSWVAHWDTC